MSSRQLDYVETSWPSATQAAGPAPRSLRVHDGARRAVNLAVAGLLLLISSPLMIVIALLVKLTSRGPVLYTQTRVGLNRRNGDRSGLTIRRRVDYGGRLFRIYKFRTMYTNGLDGDAHEVWARPGDPRVTPMGRVLRKYRLDELPQLFNVLRGDMDVVGPRPEQPKIFLRLRKQVEGFAERQRVRPGITGWAQVNHHYGTTVDDVRRKLELDLEYIARRSALEDLKIMGRTVPVVLFRRGGW